MKSTRITTWLILCLIALPAFTANAQAGEPHAGDPAPPQSILFVGNSFTFYNNSIYTHLRKLLVAQDPALRRQIFLKSMTVSGAVMADHRGGLGQALESRDWDVIVLQGHSREAIDPAMAPGFRQVLGEFSNAIRSRGAEPVLFMTWAYEGQQGMTADLADAFTALGRKLDMRVVPVGLAFARAIREIPGVRLHAGDGLHPSLEGTFLAAAVFYSALYGKSPAMLDYDAGLDEALARQLRQVAWEVVADYADSD